MNPYSLGIEKLRPVVKQLSLTRNLDDIMAIVRHAARDLTGADGATFILRDGDKCHYADEDAIGPLWKGQRFPMKACISGWVMMNAMPVLIEDIYTDARIPIDLYRPTFVKSLAMVPIRTESPIGAIGNYWAVQRQPEPYEINLLQALADIVSVTIENVGLYRDLEQRVKELETANRKKDEFLMALSHELRTPLHSILGWSELLQQGISDEKETKVGLETIQRNAILQTRLVDDLLDVSQIVTGRMSLEKENLHVGTLVKGVANSQALNANNKNITLKCDFGAPNAMVHGDHSRLTQAIENLVSNAIKFTDKGGFVEIVVGQQGPNVEIKVCDNGCGIDANFIPHLFSRFTQADSSITRKYGGLGLGLSIVKFIVEAHDGSVHAASDGPGKGSQFTILLPNTVWQK